MKILHSMQQHLNRYFDNNSVDSDEILQMFCTCVTKNQSVFVCVHESVCVCVGGGGGGGGACLSV